MMMTEEAVHFLVVCPIISGFRIKYLSKSSFNIDELTRYLNGHDWCKIIIGTS